jgi:phospholipid/cholesterol/gamma-HCH transport system substrate-binding protein
VADNVSDKKEEFKLPKRSFTTEFWVGVFTIAGLLCFSYLAIHIASIKISRSGYYQIAAIFSNISGLKVGAPVEIAGVRIGEVSNIVLKDTDAVVTLEIKDDVQLRDDDIAQIRTKGIIGDKYFKIAPGGSEDMVAANGQLSETESAVEFEDILGKIIHSLNKDEEPKPNPEPAAAL